MSNAFDALTSAIYLVKTMLPNLTDDDQRIRASGLYDDWKEGEHTVGEIYNADGMPWECYQNYDNAVYPDIRPGNAAWHTFNRPLHGKSPETALPFVQPTGAHDMYKAGEYAAFDVGVKKCVRDTAYNYIDDPTAWEDA